MTEEKEKTTVNLDLEFSNELEQLMAKYNVKAHAAIFSREESKNPILLYGPNIILATKMLNHAHTMCRTQVMKLIGE